MKFLFKEANVKEDARKFGLTLFGATLLAVAFKPGDTYSPILAFGLIILSLLFWLYGVLTKTEETENGNEQ